MSQRNYESILEGNQFKLKFKCPPAWTGPTCNNCGDSTHILHHGMFMNLDYSPTFDVADKIIFHCMFLVTNNNISYFIHFKKKHELDTLNYIIHLSIWRKSVKGKEYNVYKMDGSWHLVKENLIAEADYIVELEIKLAPFSVIYKALHEDSAYTDLELCGIDGSVHMHKIVAEACSPWFQSLFSLCPPSIENKRTVVNVKEVTVATLQNLKEYMYQGTLPESGDFKELIALSSYYKMEDLEMMCAFELSTQITTENLCDFIEFAVKNKLWNLLFEILHAVQRKKVDIHEVKKFQRIII